MSKKISWEDVFARKDIIGGEIRSVEDGCAYLGPISDIVEEGSKVSFMTLWTATYDTGNGAWFLWDYDPVFCTFDKDNVLPSLEEDGNITFGIMHMGKFKIQLAGNGKLNPAEVRGLDKKFVTG